MKATCETTNHSAHKHLKYGDPVTNIAASDSNPAKHGTFFRRGITKSRLNYGPWVEYIWGEGNTFRTSPENLVPRKLRA